MDLGEIAAFARRDWRRIEESKAAFWARAKKDISGEQALGIGDELRRFVASVRPDWPLEEDRREDWEHHRLLSERLRRVSIQRAR